MTRKEIIKCVFGIAALVILCFGFLIYSILPELSDFRNSIYGLIINIVIIGSIILYVTISKDVNLPLIGKITAWIYGFLYIVFSIIDLGRIEAIFFFIYSIGNVIVDIYVYKKTNISYRSIWCFGALAYLSTVIPVLRVEYINGEMPLTFLIPTIIGTGIAFVPCLIYGFASYNKNKDKEKLISIPLLGLLGGFALTWMTISSMNVYLDRSNPTFEEYVIIDKDVRSGARQITTYELEVKNGDVVFKIGVTEEAYYDCEINDKIILSIYSGAFNEPYYIHEDNRE